ncbi:MAG: hypothetical protein JSV43_01445 [Methanobacteriota archaeon]|nr:MAG: hypothetical protein JSV43_01445 [Euryarchaeota archaeon]
MRGPMGKRRSEFVVLLSVLILISAFPFVSQNSKAQPGQWTDTFADETKVFTKVNLEIVGGSAGIQQLASDYSWQKKGVVLDIGQGGDPDAAHAWYPWAIKDSDGMYRMWYSAVSGGDVYRIAYATSHDGYNWTKHGWVISPGFSGTGSDSSRVYGPAVIEEGVQFRMFYTAVDDSDYRNTLMAVSQDGISWTYDGLAINYGGPGESRVAGFASVLDDDGSYKSWYSGSDGGSYQMFLATSPDAVTWTKQGLVMPLGAPGEPDELGILKNVVTKNSTGEYRMWYGGFGTVWRILYAESPDGTDWNNRHGIVLYEGGLGEPDESRIAPGSVHLPVNNAGWMWYTGWDNVDTTRIMAATMGSLGNLTSTMITKSPGYDWEKLFLSKTVLPDETEVLISVLDATTLMPISGLIDLSGTDVDLSSVNKSMDSIRLRADFFGTTTETPLLHDWTVTWVDLAPPDFGGLVSATDDGTGGNVTLNWNPAPDVSPPVTYNIYMSLSSMGQNFATPDYTTQTSSIQVTGLSNGVLYYFVVRAEDSLGNEDTNLIERSAMPTTPIDSTPPTFSGLQSATDSGTGGNVTLGWNAATDPDTIECNSDPSLPIIYNIYFSETQGAHDFTTPDATTPFTNYEVTGLVSGRKYYFVVRAEDSAGNEDANLIELNATPTTPVDSEPPVFAGLESVTDRGVGGVLRLNWSLAIDSDTSECNTDPSLPIFYNIYHSTVPGGQDFQSPNATTPTTEYDIFGLQNGIPYYFVVRAQDWAGNEDANQVEMFGIPTTPEDNTPPNFTGLESAVDTGTGGAIDLSWLAAMDPDTTESNSDPSLPTAYDIFYSTTSGGQDFLSPNTTTTGLSMGIAGLPDGVPHYFVVRARDSVGNQESNTIERMAIPTTSTDATPPDFAGALLAMDSQSGGSVTLTWAQATDPDTVECNSDPSEPITYSVYVSTQTGAQNFLLPNATTQNTQIEITGLANGVTYYFIVRAEDAVDNEESNMVELSAMPTTPLDSTPPSFGGLSGASDAQTDGVVDLSWTAANDPDLTECNSDPSTPITYYVYYSMNSGGQDFQTPATSTQNTAIQLTGLQNGVDYYFVVRAEDSASNRESNTVERIATPTTALDTTPPQFAGLTSANDAGTDGDVSLTWPVATDPETTECNSDPSIPIQYNVYVSVISGGQDFANPNQTSSDTGISLTGLENGIMYYFVVRAEDATGNEDDNIVERYAIPTTAIDNTPPTFSGLIAAYSDNKTGDITLTWNPASDPDDPGCTSDPSTPVKYNIYLSEYPTFDYTQPEATTQSQQYVFTDLGRGVTYYFAVRAEDGAGNEETNTVERSAQLTKEEEPFNILDYWWISLVVTIIILLAIMAIQSARRGKKEESLKKAEEESSEEEE